MSTKEPPNSGTIYSVGSLTKAFTAAAVARLFADDEKYSWSTPVDNILYDFTPKDGHLRGLLSVGDLFSQRSGLFGDMSIALQGDSEFLIPPEDTLHAVSDLDTIASFREEWSYNNWGYSIAGLVIEKMSKLRFSDYLRESIPKPLNLTSTTTFPTDCEDNFADAYYSLRDASLYPSTRRFPSFKDSIFEAAGGSTRTSMTFYAGGMLSCKRRRTLPAIH